MITEIYKNAFAEVYEILGYLNDEDYNKIPEDVIVAIEENKNENYNYYLDESLPFFEQEMMEETKAILFNIYRDYLASEERKDKILEYQREEIKILENNKAANYKENSMFKKRYYKY